ncbi:MAG TPA: DNA polymerase III subunit gamma/tau [Candidatus Limnocylindrales bacterium]|nr:DNA polymerase III subunit gamma/tau [Candidatus Limnocylindrales bacterium]
MSPTAPHQAIYRRWRAQTFSQIVGQAAVVETLRNAVRAGRVSHAILFVGPRGTGKTSLARILAKALNCTDLRDGDPCDACPSCVAIREGRALDLVEIDAASNRGIDAIRELRERINYAPTDLRRKVYILDEAHQITKDAWNALLKSLEEPPDFVAFMFASTHPQDFPPAILSRLQRYDVRRLTVPEIEGKLDRILEAESIQAEPAAVALIARLAAGGMRDAESMLDQLLASAGGRIDEASVRELLGLAEAEAVDRLVAALVDGDPVAGIAVLDELEDRGRDVGVVLDQVVEAIRTRLSAGLTDGADPVMTAGLARVARRLAEIDPERRGVGGLRLQVELALFAGGGAGARVPVFATAPRPASELPETADEPPPRHHGQAAPVAEPPAAEPPVADPPAAQSPTAEMPDRPPTMTSEVKPARSAAAVAVDSPAHPLPDAESNAPAAAAAGPLPQPAEPTSTETPAAPLDATSGPDARPATPGGGDALEWLRGQWPEIVEHISRHPPTKPLIAACRPISVEGNVVTLGFPEGQGFLKDVAERRRANLEEGIGHFLGRPVTVRCVATNVDTWADLPADDDGARLVAEARRIFADDLVDVGEIG